MEFFKTPIMANVALAIVCIILFVLVFVVWASKNNKITFTYSVSMFLIVLILGLIEVINFIIPDFRVDPSYKCICVICFLYALFFLMFKKTLFLFWAFLVFMVSAFKVGNPQYEPYAVGMLAGIFLTLGWASRQKTYPYPNIGRILSHDPDTSD